MATEIETKLIAPSPEILDIVFQDAEILQYALDDFTSLHMKTVYYDTPDNQMYERNWTLRLREENGQSVAALKTGDIVDTAGFSTRNEWQCAVDNIQDAIPILIDMGAPRELKSILKGRKLVPCCGAEFERKSVCLFLEDGIRIEMSGDTGTLFAGDRREPLCELELELLYGNADSLPPLRDQILADYPLQEETRSKYARAHALLNDPEA